MSRVADLVERLGELHLRTRETPLFNPVFQLSLDLSRELESGSIGLDRIEALVAELECEALQSRAGSSAMRPSSSIFSDSGLMTPTRQSTPARSGLCRR